MSNNIKIAIKRIVITVMFVTVMLFGFNYQNITSAFNTQNESSSDKFEIENLTDKVNSFMSDEYAETNKELATLDDSDLVWVIVELKQEATLDKYLTSSRNIEYNEFLAKDSMITYTNELEQLQNEVLTNLASKIEIEKKYNYTSILNGFAALVKYGDVAKIEKESLVKDVIISEKYAIPQVEEVSTNNVNVYETGIYDSSDISYDGENTIVAILDTGLDYYHSAFQNQPTGQLAVNRDKIDDLLTDTQAYKLALNDASNPYTLTSDKLYVSSKVPFAYDYSDNDPDVYPVEDHGTHVAGIIAGKDSEITGVATNAQLAIMKVFSNYDSGAGTMDILAALTDCVTLNVDVINMSLGLSAGFAREEDDDAINAIYDKIKEQGISLIVAASNDYSSAMGSENGDTNLTSNPDSGTVGSPASYAAALAVASISGVKTKYFVANGTTNVYFTESAKTTGDRNDFVNQILGENKTGTFEYVTIPGIGSSGDYYGLDVTGKIALVQRGSSSFEEKTLIAQAKGAVGIIIYNNTSGTISMSVGNNTRIPSCSITMDLGTVLASEPSGTVVFDTTYMAGPFMSAFSSWGTLPNLELKPDITAHGGEIYSAVRGGYDRISGTSMACPNMAGATLLVREYVKETYPELQGQEITELAYQLMMSTATIANNEEGNPYSPRKQGAGLADIKKAITTSAYLWTDDSNKTKITYGDDENKTGVYNLEFNLTNLSNAAISYDVNPYIMTEKISVDGKTVAERAYMFNDSKVTVTASNDKVVNNKTVIVEGYKTIKVTVKIELTDDEKQYLNDNFVNGMYVEGYITLENNDSNGVDLNIPWLAFYGDWTQAPMLDVTAYEVSESILDDSILDRDKLKADVYATLPMGGFRVQTGTNTYEDATWGLGDYGYRLADGYEKPVAEEDKASISENINGTYKIAAIYAGLLRGAKEMDIIITNSATGEVVYHDISYNNRKSYYTGARRPGYIELDIDPKTYGMQNNTKYTFTMVGKLDWDDEQNNLKNSFTFDFYIDSEAPILMEEQTELRIRETSSGERTYLLDMYVYDNHYLQAYTMATYSGIRNGELVDRKALFNYTIPIDSARGTTNRVTLDITDYWNDIEVNGENLYVELIDYAKNTSAYSIKIPKVCAENISFTSNTQGEDYSVNVKINETIDTKRNMVLTPSNARVDEITWTSSNEEIARVYKGEVMGVSEGEAEITATTELGARTSFKVTVSGKKSDEIVLQNLELNKTVAKIEQGEELELTVTLEPWNITDPSKYEVSWASSNTNILEVTADPNDPFKAIVKGVSDGTARIIVTSGLFMTNSCTVTVEDMFTVEGGILTDYKGRGDKDGLVTIPDDEGIMYIYDYTFFGNEYIKKVIVPEGVTEIREAAFYGMDNLEEVILPESLETIGRFAFAWNPKLKKVTLGGTVTIKELAFYNCPLLEDIDLSNVYSIGNNAFTLDRSLTSIDISNAGFTGSQAFARCTGLTEIIMSERTSIGDLAFYQCTGLTDLVIPTDNVGGAAFANSTALTSVTFTNNIDNIDDEAFYGCRNLKTISFLGEVRRIGARAFAYNSTLETITLPNGLEEIGDVAFAECTRLKTLIIPAGCKLSELKAGLFQNCANLANFQVEPGNRYLATNDGILYDKGYVELLLVPYAKRIGTKFTVLPSVKKIGDYALSYNTQIREIDLQNVEYIGEGAFYSCSYLNKITYGTKLLEIGKLAFYSCQSLPEITIPEGVISIKESAFAGASTATTNVAFELVLPSTLKELGYNSFRSVKALTSVQINEGLEYISAQAFADCPNLSNVMIPETVKGIGDSAFAATAITEIHLPESLEELGRAVFAETLLTTVQLPSKITTIPELTYYNCKNLVSISFYPHITTIGDRAFEGCSNLVDVAFNFVVNVNYRAFYGTKITTIQGEHINYVGDYAFANITSLKTVNIGNVLEIGTGSFYGCGNIDYLFIEDVEKIGSQAFMHCLSIDGFALPNVEVILDQAFYDTGITTITLPNVVYIGNSAFQESKIKTAVISDTTSFIGIKAFDNNNLENFDVDSNNKTYFDESGVLYKYLANGTYELVCYPVNHNNQIFEYYVLNNTSRIADSAFEGNKNLKSLIFPKELKLIGDSAFFNTMVYNYTFRSYNAPVLETVNSDNSSYAEYKNFVDNVKNASALELTMTYPSNGVGYDEYTYKSYFKNTNLGPEVSREETTSLQNISAIVNDEDSNLVMAGGNNYNNNLKKNNLTDYIIFSGFMITLGITAVIFYTNNKKHKKGEQA